MDDVERARKSLPMGGAAHIASMEFDSWLREAPIFTFPGEVDFGQVVEALPPGPLLWSFVDEARYDPGNASETDLVAALRATERLIADARRQQLALIEEMARRA